LKRRYCSHPSKVIADQIRARIENGSLAFASDRPSFATRPKEEKAKPCRIVIG
jgi:hypothetical protein